MTVRHLARVMTEAELVNWQRFAAKRMLPARRMEMHMAQLSMLVAVTMGGSKDAKLADFLFDAPDTSEPTADEIAEYFDFHPRNKKA